MRLYASGCKRIQAYAFNADTDTENDTENDTETESGTETAPGKGVWGKTRYRRRREYAPMTKEEVREAIEVLALAYPTSEKFKSKDEIESVVSVWFPVLIEDDAEQVMKAITEHITESTEPPSLAGIKARMCYGKAVFLRGSLDITGKELLALFEGRMSAADIFTDSISAADIFPDNEG